MCDMKRTRERLVEEQRPPALPLLQGLDQPPIVKAIVNGMSPISFYSLYCGSQRFKHQCDRLKITFNDLLYISLKKCLYLAFPSKPKVADLLSSPSLDHNIYITGGLLVAALHADYQHIKEQKISDVDLVVVPKLAVDSDGEKAVHQKPSVLKVICDLYGRDNVVLNWRMGTDMFDHAPTRVTVTSRRLDKFYGSYGSPVAGICDLIHPHMDTDVTISFIYSACPNIEDHVKFYDLDVCKNYWSIESGIRVAYPSDLARKDTVISTLVYLDNMVCSLSPSKLIISTFPDIDHRLEKYRKRGFTIRVKDWQIHRLRSQIEKNPKNWFIPVFESDVYNLAGTPFSTTSFADTRYQRDPAYSWHILEFCKLWEHFWKSRLNSTAIV